MAKIVDYNLYDEIAHACAVSVLSRELSKELGENETRQESIALAGFLHDIGKLKLADYLGGPSDEGTLLVEEMKYVRMHPELSAEILKAQGFSDEICESVRCHHENFDGSGYPENLAGYAIPRAARIIRVCDVFAALTSDRPYRNRFSAQEALSLMIDEINHFDMEIFLALQAVVHRIGDAYRLPPDAIVKTEENMRALLEL